MLAQKNRIGGGVKLETLAKRGREKRTPHLIFRFLPTLTPSSAFAVTVSQKIAKHAVDRNRLRRQIAEALRIQQDILKAPWEIFVIARPAVQKLDFQEIAAEIIQFFNQLNTDAK